MANLSPSTPSSDPQILALKDWLRATQSHELLPTPSAVKQDSVTMGYSLQIRSASNLDIRSMRCHMTLYHKGSSTFFGRTFMSRSNANEAVAILSQIKDEGVFVVCELVNIRMIQETFSGASAVAWAFLELFTQPGTKQSPMFPGSCRGLVSGIVPAASQLVLEYDLTLYPELASVSPVMPLNAIIGLTEQVPGLVRGLIPMPGSQPQLDRGSGATLRSLVLIGGGQLDEKVITFAMAWRRDTLGVTDNVKPVIQERKVLVGQHNSWHCVGGGLEASSQLRPTPDGNLECTSQLTLRDYFPSPCCALIFELEYNVTVPRAANQGSEFLKLIAAWTPFPTTASSEVPVSIRLLFGPGYSITGKLLMNAGGDLPIQLNFILSTKDSVYGGQASYAGQSSYSPISAQQSIGRGTISVRGDLVDEEGIRRQVAAEKDREIQTLKMQLDDERRRALEASQVVSLPPPPPARLTSTSEVQTAAAEPPPRKQVFYSDAQIETVEPATFESPTRPEYLQTIVPVPLTAPTQMVSFVSAPSLAPRDISRGDRARLVRAGVGGLLEGADGSASLLNPRLDIEAEDPLSAAIFLIQFLSYRTPPRGAALPMKLHFSLRFYNFPNFVTDTVHFAKGENGSPWVLVKDGPEQDLVLKFEVEPVAQDRLAFVKYLAKKQVSVSVWDAESLMLLGLARMPLAELLRQGKPQVTITKEYPVVDQFTSEPLGSIQLLIRHIGKSPAVLDRLQPSQNPLKLTTGTQSIVQKRKIRSKAIEMTPNMSASLPLTSEDQRKKARVMEWKKAAAGTTAPGDWEKQEMLRQATLMRETKKPEVIKAKLREYYSSGFVMSAKQGVASVLQYSLQNPYSHEECFSILIEDPKKELTLVTAPAEWQYWVSHRDLDRPAEWDMISKDLSVILKPYETVPLVFKYFSQSPEAAELKVWIHQSKGASVSALEFQIKPQAGEIDHIFRFFEEEKSNKRIQLPPLYSSSHSGTPPILVCSLPKAMVQWDNDQQISVQLRVPDAPVLTRFNILAYSDPYFGDLQANWEVEVHSLVGVVVKTSQGQLSSVKLVCPGDEPRTVALYSSDPEMISFPPPYNSPFTLLPKTSNNVGLTVRNDSSITRRVRVHLVDVHHKLLVHAWSLELQSSSSSVAQVYQVKCSLGVPSDKKIQYVNRTQSWALFNFRSSHPDLLQIKDPRLALEAGAQGYISVHFPGRMDPGVVEVSVFAADSEEAVFETLLFKIEFM